MSISKPAHAANIRTKPRMKSVLLKPDGPRSANQASVGRRCHERPFPAIALILSLSLAAIFPSSARGQDQPPPARADRKPIQIRVLCSEIVAGETAMSLLQNDKVVHDIDLVRSLVSDPLGFARGEIVLARRAAEGQTPEPLFRIPVPKAGTRFVLALFPVSDDDHKTHYQPVLIRTDNLNFNTADLFMMNLTRVSIGGTVGTQKFSLAPRQMNVITPDPPAGDRMYQARFYYERDGRPHPFSDTRWPRSNSARVYLFFLPDPERQSISYLSFREYAPYP